MPDNPQTKFCSKCNRELSLIEFYIDRSKKDGLNNKCKTCRDKYAREYYHKNITTQREKKREQQRKTREKNSARKKNPRKRLLEMHPNYDKDYYWKNHEKRRQKSIDYYRRNQDKVIARRRELHHNKKLEVLDFLGGPICRCCGFNNPLALSIDHVHNDGARERGSGKVGYSIYAKILGMSQNAARERYQVLCRNCNWIKYLESGGT